MASTHIERDLDRRHTTVSAAIAVIEAVRQPAHSRLRLEFAPADHGEVLHRAAMISMGCALRDAVTGDDDDRAAIGDLSDALDVLAAIACSSCSAPLLTRATAAAIDRVRRESGTGLREWLDNEERQITAALDEAEGEAILRGVAGR